MILILSRAGQPLALYVRMGLRFSQMFGGIE